MDIKEIIQNISENIQDHFYGYTSIASYLRSKSTQLDSTEGLEMCQLLAYICSVSFDANYSDDPYGLNENNDIKQKSSLLVSILNDINEPLLKGRVADILWLYNKPKDVNHATLVIDSLSSIRLKKNSYPNDVYESWQRALVIAKQINDNQRIDRILNLMLQTIDDYIDDKYVPLKMAKMIYGIDIDCFKNNHLSEKMLEIAKNRKSDSDCNLLEAIDYLDFAAESFSKTNPQKSSEINNLKALFIEQNGDIRKLDSAFASNHFYKKSLIAFQQVQTKFRGELNTNESITRVRTKITETNKQSLSELTMSEFPVDVSTLTNNAINAVKGNKKLEEVLTIFTQFLNKEPNYQQLKDNYQPSLIDTLGGKKAISPVDGRTISKNTPFDHNNQDSIEQCRENQAVERFMVSSNIIVTSKLLPALQVINKEHVISKEYLEELCKASNIIPNNRKKLVSHGLYAGFQDDWYTSTHILCPQFEHIIRTLLEHY